jgi:hypothetical protein
MAREGFLGASFFICRQDETRRYPRNICRTLAYDLAFSDWSHARAVWNELNSTPHLASLPIREQVIRLLSKHFGLVQIDNRSTIIVIDALDESIENDEDYHEEGRLIPLLVSAFQNQAVKIFVTSRNEQYIANYFVGIDHDGFKLYYMEKSDASRDIRSFYEYRFHQLVLSHQLGTADWPSTTHLHVLTERTGHLFVYASTIMTFVSAARFDPIERLDSILKHERDPIDRDNVFGPLDKLYMHIIASAVTHNRVINVQLRDRVVTLIGTILLLQHPLRFSSIVALLVTLNSGYSTRVLRTDLESLSSVIPVPESDVDPVEIFHPSFPDFMQDASRCRDPHLRISPPNAHLHIAVACLRLMNSCLRQDICDIQDFTLLNSEITDLQKRLDRCISESLGYSCEYWIQHLVSAPASPTLIEELEKFCEHHLFHWIEVLSLLKVKGTHDALMRAAKWCRVCLLFRPLIPY